MIFTAWLSLFSVESKLSSGIDSSIWNFHLKPTIKIFKFSLGNQEHSNDKNQIILISAMNVWSIPGGILNNGEVKCFSLNYILQGQKTH